MELMEQPTVLEILLLKSLFMMSIKLALTAR